MIHVYKVMNSTGKTRKVLANEHGKAEIDCSWEEFLKRISQMAFKNRAHGLDRLHFNKITTTAPLRESGNVFPWTKVQESDISRALNDLICE